MRRVGGRKNARCLVPFFPSFGLAGWLCALATLTAAQQLPKIPPTTAASRSVWRWPSSPSRGFDRSCMGCVLYVLLLLLMLQAALLIPQSALGSRRTARPPQPQLHSCVHTSFSPSYELGPRLPSPPATAPASAFAIVDDQRTLPWYAHDSSRQRCTLDFGRRGVQLLLSQPPYPASGVRARTAEPCFRLVAPFDSNNGRPLPSIGT